MGMQLGEEVTWTRPDGTKRRGTVSGVRKSGTVIETADGDFEGFQIEIDHEEWTPTFPDRAKPVPRPESAVAI